MNSPTVRKALSWLVAVLVPVALVLTAVRMMFTPLFLQVEYNLPGFPPDPYGFTTQDRLRWSQYALDYLVHNEPISYLGDLRFDDGAPLYNERELSHMVDVQNTVNGALTVWTVSLVGLALLGLWAYLGKWWPTYAAGLSRGGWLTVLLLGTIVVLVLLTFSTVFVAFHNVFFAPGTWMFYTSDTLIRLFPERFWRDIFIIVGTTSLLGGLALAFIFGRVARRAELQTA